MPTATAFVDTSRRSATSSSWSATSANKVLTDEGGRLEFDFGTCDLEAAASGIELTATAADHARLETLKDVVARHLIRLALMISSSSAGRREPSQSAAGDVPHPSACSSHLGPLRDRRVAVQRATADVRRRQREPIEHFRSPGSGWIAPG